MNKLSITLFLNKYYDWIFIFVLLLFLATVNFYEKLSILKKAHSVLKRLFSGKRFSLLLLIIFALGFLVRTYKINSPLADWHSFRQADTASATRLFVEGSINLFYPKYHDISRVQSGIFNPNGYRFVEFPLYNFLNAILVRALPVFSLEVWGRLISITSSLFTAVIIYKLGKRFISTFGAVISLLFYLFIPFNIFFTRVILPEPLAVFFVIFSLWYFVRYFDKKGVFNLYLSSLFFALSLLIKPYTIFYSIPIIYLAISKNSFKRLFGKKYVISALFAVLPFILWRLWMSQFPEGIPFWKWTFNGDAIRFKPSFWYWIIGERLTKLILGYLGIIPFFIGLVVKRKDKFIAYLSLGIFLYVSVFATANVRHDYYQSIAIPAISLIFSSGFVTLWNSGIYNLKLTRCFLIIFSTLMITIGSYQVKEFYKINHPEIILAGEAVDRLTPKNSLVIADYNGDTTFLYHTKRRGWPVVELPINELISEGASYYTSVSLDNPQTREFMRKFEVVEKTNEYVVIRLN